MPDTANLYLFVVAVVLLLIVPGPNMAFVTSHALAHGWRAGVAAALGISFSDALMTMMVSAGIGALVMSWAPAFDILRLAGAGYLLWLAWQALRTPAATQDSQLQSASLWKIFCRGALNSLLNPKALLFFMVFLPQFVNVKVGGVSLQLIFLGAAAGADCTHLPYAAGCLRRTAQGETGKQRDFKALGHVWFCRGHGSAGGTPVVS